MAMKPCKECGQPVSTKAGFCPHCGKKDPARPTRYGCGTGCLVLIVVLFGVGLIGSLFDGSGPSPSSPSSARSSPSMPRLNQVYYTKKAVNVRSGPGTDHAVAYTLGAGYRTYPGNPNGDGWAPVFGGPRTTTDTVGWVLKELLTFGNPPDLLLSSWNWKPGSRSSPAYITGEIVNTTLKTFSYVQIICTLFDSQGRQIGSAMDNVNNLGDGQTWSFSALVMEDNAKTYRCSEPTGW